MHTGSFQPSIAPLRSIIPNVPALRSEKVILRSVVQINSRSYIPLDESVTSLVGDLPDRIRHSQDGGSFPDRIGDNSILVHVRTGK